MGRCLPTLLIRGCKEDAECLWQFATQQCRLVGPTTQAAFPSQALRSSFFPLASFCFPYNAGTPIFGPFHRLSGSRFMVVFLQLSQRLLS